MLQFFVAVFLFLHGKYFFSHKKIIQGKDILNRLQPSQNPRTEVLLASYGTI